MSVELLEKRERRRIREQRKLASFKRAVQIFDHPKEALRYLPGLITAWDAVRRVASAIIQRDVRDIGVAWGIVYYVAALPDGKKRLKAATAAALALWEREMTL